MNIKGIAHRSSKRWVTCSWRKMCFRFQKGHVRILTCREAHRLHITWGKSQSARWGLASQALGSVPGGALWKLPWHTTQGLPHCSVLAQRKAPGEPRHTQTLCTETLPPVCSGSFNSSCNSSKPRHRITNILQHRLHPCFVPSAQDVVLSQIVSLLCPSRWKYNLSFLYVCTHPKNSHATEYRRMAKNSAFNLDALTGVQWSESTANKRCIQKMAGVGAVNTYRLGLPWPPIGLSQINGELITTWRNLFFRQ